MAQNHDDLITHYSLKPHPEGGYYRETYRAQETFLRDGKLRQVSTAIYYLLPHGEKSHLHRIQSDEIWHFYLGGPLVLHEIFPDGQTRETNLGHDFSKGQVLQHVVPAGNWFGATPAPGARYSFCGCTVAPGFDFADFEIGEKRELLKSFPHAAAVIERMCRY